MDEEDLWNYLGMGEGMDSSDEEMGPELQDVEERALPFGAFDSFDGRAMVEEYFDGPCIQAEQNDETNGTSTFDVADTLNDALIKLLNHVDNSFSFELRYFFFCFSMIS